MQNSEEVKTPFIRVSSETNFLQNKELAALVNGREGRGPSFSNERELIALKEDYNKFKQKILA